MREQWQGVRLQGLAEAYLEFGLYSKGDMEPFKVLSRQVQLLYGTWI